MLDLKKGDFLEANNTKWVMLNDDLAIAFVSSETGKNIFKLVNTHATLEAIVTSTCELDGEAMLCDKSSFTNAILLDEIDLDTYDSYEDEESSSDY